MSARCWIAVTLLVGACSGGAGGGDDDDDDGPATDARVTDTVVTDIATLDAPADALVIDAPAIDAPAIDAPPGSNGGFVTPTAVTKANVEIGGAWTEVGDADWSCLGTPSPDQPSTGTIALSGRIGDFQTGNGVGAATITGWSTSPAMTVGTTISSSSAATRGDYAMTLGMLPSGTTRYGFTITATSYTSTVVLRRYYAPGPPATDDLDAISDATATAIPAFVGVTRDSSAALYFGRMRDCQGRTVSNAVAAISLTATTYDNAGGETFYFSAGSPSLPVRHNVAPTMNDDGMFVVLNVPPGATLHAQVWGFRTLAELNANTLTLLGEVHAPSTTGQSVLMELEPRRS